MFKPSFQGISFEGIYSNEKQKYARCIYFHPEFKNSIRKVLKTSGNLKGELEINHINSLLTLFIHRRSKIDQNYEYGSCGIKLY